MNKILFIMIISLMSAQAVFDTRVYKLPRITFQSLNSVNNISKPIYNIAIQDVKEYYNKSNSKKFIIQSSIAMSASIVAPGIGFYLTEDIFFTFILSMTTPLIISNLLLNTNYSYQYNDFYNTLNNKEKLLYEKQFKRELKTYRTIDIIKGTFVSIMLISLLLVTNK